LVAVRSVARAASREELLELGAAVHDLWFSLEQVARDSNGRTVVIPLERAESKPGRSGWRSVVRGKEPAAVLTVRRVRGLSIDDEAEVDEYEVDRIDVETRNSAMTITLEATIPLSLAFEVDEIDVAVEWI
jgi:hypothetical protein